jgi:hypothetical protein
VEGRVVGVARRGGTANFLSVNDAEKKKKKKKRKRNSPVFLPLSFPHVAMVS